MRKHFKWAECLILLASIFTLSFVQISVVNGRTSESANLQTSQVEESAKGNWTIFLFLFLFFSVAGIVCLFFYRKKRAKEQEKILLELQEKSEKRLEKRRKKHQ